MADLPLRLPYTSHRHRYKILLWTMLGLALLESALIAGVIAAVAPAPLRWALLGGLAAMLIVVGLWLVAPLHDAHRLTASALELRFGPALRADVPLARIAGARLAAAPAGMRSGAAYERRERQLRVGLAPEGLLQIDLAEPLVVRVGLRGGGPVESILVSLDEPQLLLDALTPGANPRPAPATIPADRAGRAPALAASPAAPHVRLETLPAGRAAPLTGAAAVAGQRGGAIVAEGLTRRFGARTAVDGLSLAVAPGEIYGFLGPNGAGKSTTIKMLAGLLAPSAGRVSIAGHDVWDEPIAARAALGYVPDRAPLYDRLSGRELLSFLAQMRGLPRAESEARIVELIATLDLAEQADRLCGAYSLGTRRKLSLAAALLHRPTALILDEPLNGLDPRAAHKLKATLAELAAGGAAILLSTHDLPTAEALCSRVGLVDRGRLIAEGTPEELRAHGAADDLEGAFLTLTAGV